MVVRGAWRRLGVGPRGGRIADATSLVAGRRLARARQRGGRAFRIPVLSTATTDGFPFSVPVLGASFTHDAFDLKVSGSVPDPDGAATLSFGSYGAFRGSVRPAGTGTARFDVAYMFGSLPRIFTPDDEERAALMERLHAELRRRSQPVPEVRLPGDLI